MGTCPGMSQISWGHGHRGACPGMSQISQGNGDLPRDVRGEGNRDLPRGIPSLQGAGEHSAHPRGMGTAAPPGHQCHRGWCSRRPAAPMGAPSTHRAAPGRGKLVPDPGSCPRSCPQGCGVAASFKATTGGLGSPPPRQRADAPELFSTRLAPSPCRGGRGGTGLCSGCSVPQFPHATLDTAVLLSPCFFLGQVPGNLLYFGVPSLRGVP